ncbi:hypothetical protein [Microbispora sp. GKU 823]|uniref:hypothetical protein n=1 Tax=Microbispora sp. GKU 823 TaxID=1652100 RepID=UPI002117B2B8|nr:hypothetical protein [Microbispora sp. GKU 823]
MPRLAISPEFLRGLGALSRPVRRDVAVAVRRFLLNASAAPHPERVRNCRDPRVATLRLADRHRGVVVRQEDVYWLLTVLPDAEAWSYAQRHRVGVNTAIGIVETWDAEALERIEPALRRASETGGRPLFENWCDNDLLNIGIDPRLLPLLRLMTSESHLAAVEPLLPHSQYAPLAALARGGSLAAAWRELDACRSRVADEIDPEDLLAALRRSPDRPRSPPTPPSSSASSRCPAGARSSIPRSTRTPTGRRTSSRCSSPGARAPGRRSSHCTGRPCWPARPPARCCWSRSRRASRPSCPRGST